MREEEGRIIELVSPETCDIDELVAGVTDENLHDTIDTGPPEGFEVW